MRGEIIWLKQRGSSGSCAWGSFQRPGNPVLRDLTERIVVASKGRFDRALPARERQRTGLPSEVTMTREDFMENTLDVWEVPPESATQIGHPAPFPVELPSRLISLFTYKEDLVLDPFVGSGSTAVAAVRTGRHYVGYDLDDSYVRLAESRVVAEQQRLAAEGADGPVHVSLPAIPAEPAHPDQSEEELWVRAIQEGKAAKEIAGMVIAMGGFTDIREGQRQPGGVEVTFSGQDSKGTLWLFDVSGSFTSHRAGLQRADTLWKALGKAAVLREAAETRLVLLTTDTPAPGSAGAKALKQLTGLEKPIYAVITMTEPTAPQMMRDLYQGVQRNAG